MAKRKTTRKTTSTVTKPNPVPHPKEIVQDALQTTWLLKGNLKNVQLAYLRVAVLLAKVRDKKLYAALNHPDMESYAQQRLSLGRSSLYNYLRVHDWVGKSHPEWLKPKTKGFIPDISDVGDLMWIETELARTDLDAGRRVTLEELRKKGLAGNLRQSEVRKFRQKEPVTGENLKTLISSLQMIRKRAGKIPGFPPEAISHLDAAIELANHENSLKMAGFRPFFGTMPQINEAHVA